MNMLSVTGNRVDPVRRIAIVAPSSRPDPEAVEAAQAQLAAAGFEVRVDPRCFLDAGWTAGPDAERLAALNAALADPQIDCILCARGGFGSPKIADEAIAPRGRKVVVGYSDATYLLARLSAFENVIPVHGPMAQEFLNPAKAENVAALIALLRGEDLSARVQASFAERLDPVRAKPFRARLAGGNLVLVQMTLGTANAGAFAGKALMLEDVGERMYELDRALDHLRRGGVLAQAAALAVGDMSPKPDDGGFGDADLRRTLMALGERLDLPVLAGLPIGHGAANLPIAWGAELAYGPPGPALVG